jgi:F-type H+-transporting ATPase subunit alpha
VNEVLKQGQFDPRPLADEVLIIYAVNNGFLDDVPVDKVAAFEDALRRYAAGNQRDLLDRINTEKQLTEEIQEGIRNALTTFKETVPY